MKTTLIIIGVLVIIWILFFAPIFNGYRYTPTTGGPPQKKEKVSLITIINNQINTNYPPG